MIFNWVCSIIKGLWLSGSVYVLGKILDEYVSGETKQLIITPFNISNADFLSIKNN